MARISGLYRRGNVMIAAVFFLLTMAAPARAELTVQGWLDFYNGRSASGAVAAKIIATSYALGMADGLISTRVMACPPKYTPDPETLVRRVAIVLSDPNPPAGISVTAAVLVALDIDGCTKGPLGKAK